MWLALGAMMLGLGTGPVEVSAQSAFPHEKHSVFFSECSACHTGAEQVAGKQGYPDPSLCAGCHDGATAPAVSWQAPGPRKSNLRFTHAPHPFDCATCHLPEGPENLAAMALPEPEVCVGCHAPGVEHQQTEDCGFCHRTVTEVGSPSPGVSPPFHEAGFATSHGAAASLGQPDCRGCHTETTCLGCHEGQSSPSFHPLNFLASHGPEAYGRVSDCSACHSTEAFCRECHVGIGFQAGGGTLSTPFHNDQPVWVLSHSQAARQDLESCTSCHQQTDCLTCHSAQAGWGINPHGPGFDGASLADRNKMLCSLCHITG
jgi:predicted CXXCH cytochrome family protein